MMPFKRGRGRPPKNPQAHAAAMEAIAHNNARDSGGPPQGLPVNLQAKMRDFTCQICDKSYINTSALNLHMKIKHQQGEGKNIDPLIKRGRG